MEMSSGEMFVVVTVESLKMVCLVISRDGMAIYACMRLPFFSKNIHTESVITASAESEAQTPLQVLNESEALMALDMNNRRNNVIIAL